MTRDQLREHFKKNNLRCANLSDDQLERLRSMVDEQAQASGLYDGSYRADQNTRIRKPKTKASAHIHCTSDAFNQREAVSFHPDGFIGFAGWADEESYRPIAKAFLAWVDEIVSEQAKSPA
jgi:hypothetical protein